MRENRVVSGTDSKFLTCSEVRDTLVMLVGRRVEKRLGDLVQE